MRLAWDNDGSLGEESSPKTLETTGAQVSGKIYWAGTMSTYFLAAVLPGDTSNVTVKGRMYFTKWECISQLLYLYAHIANSYFCLAKIPSNS